MTIASGTTLGHYEILGSLGAGGMGEVYRARDTSLGREVAIKVLPEDLAQDAERLARFDREAHVLASLNHPNIATLYGFEHDGDIRFLVMELVEGETLADRIARGPIPIDEALGLFLQIAEGLEAAHEKGVIHRDLKPANIEITDDARVKILDFGLAKAMQPEIPEVDLTHSPTLSGEATRAGVILGTAPYMSPEQARGKVVDKRADIWAFGCCLFEALTGRRAFEADSAPGTLALVLEREPDWEALSPGTPVPLRGLLRRCLAKELRDRQNDIGDARLELSQMRSGAREEEPILVVAPARPARRTVVLAVCAGLLIGLLASAVLWQGTKATRSSGSERVTRLSIALPPGLQLLRNERAPLALSPDGTRLVFVAQGDNRTRLYLRSLDSYESVPIPGTEDAQMPFFSPDGEWIGFFANRKLNKVAVAGGAPLPLADVRGPYGASWGPDDRIVFSEWVFGLGRVAASGGPVEWLTAMDSREAGYGHTWPQYLPDGESVLFSVWGGSADVTGAAVLSLASGKWRMVLPGRYAAWYANSGHLLSMPIGRVSVVANPFDSRSLRVGSASAPVLVGIHWAPGSGAFSFAISAGGDFAYVPETRSSQSLVWVDRTGSSTPLKSDLGTIPLAPRLSPGGHRLAFAPTTMADAKVGATGLQLLDLERDTLLGLSEAEDLAAAWSPDGSQLAFSSNRAGSWDLYLSAADGSGARPLLIQEHQQFALSWSANGRVLAFEETHPETGIDLWLLPLDGEPEPLLVTPANEGALAFSPDGHWLAYVSDESGRYEVYLQSYPDLGTKWPVSADGGSEPCWSRDGSELFYRRGNQMLAVPIRSGSGNPAGKPELLFEAPYDRHGFGEANYDVAADGRFVMVADSSATEIRVVLNWFEELERLVPKE